MSYLTIGTLKGLTIITVETALARASISLFGAQILSFTPKYDGKERLWLSPDAVLDKSKPIRGGIPLCWPWFGACPTDINCSITPAPAHGFARSADWQLSSHQQNTDGSVDLTLIPQTPFQTPLVPTLHICVGRSLTVTLATLNTSDEPAVFYAALHSYFNVDDIHRTVIEGISGDYIDKLTQQTCTTAADYRISGETDRIHLGCNPAITLHNGEHTTTIQSFGEDSIVVWNPWRDGSKAMVDMPDNGYTTLLCLETARTQQGEIGAGETHNLTQIIN